MRNIFWNCFLMDLGGQFLLGRSAISHNRYSDYRTNSDRRTGSEENNLLIRIEVPFPRATTSSFVSLRAPNI